MDIFPNIYIFFLYEKIKTFIHIFFSFFSLRGLHRVHQVGVHVHVVGMYMYMQFPKTEMQFVSSMSTLLVLFPDQFPKNKCSS